MRIYIAYKFTNIEDKKILKKKLLHVVEMLHNQGNTTYLLGRDLQQWGKNKHPLLRKIRIIIGQIRKSDYLLAFVTSPVFSKGILFELITARLLGKRIKLAKLHGINTKVLSIFATSTVEFENATDLEKQLKQWS